MNDSAHSLSIVIVSYNCADALRTCLQSLLTTAISARIIVVDNSSTDNSVAMLQKHFPSVYLLVNPENQGFAAACNRGIRTADSEFILLLNPDTTVSGETLPQLLTVMKTDASIGVCGPRILNSDGSLQPSCRRFPTLGRIVLDEFGLRAPYRMSQWPHDKRREVDQLMGACLLLRSKALDQVGLFDERFFVYYEEVDLCLRLKQAGWRVLFVPEVTIIHQGGQTSKRDKIASLRHRYHSLFEFYRKYYPRWHLVLLKTVVQVTAILRICIGQHEYTQIAQKVWRL